MELLLLRSSVIMYREVEGPGYVASKSWLLWTVDAWLLRITSWMVLAWTCQPSLDGCYLASQSFGILAHHEARKYIQIKF